MATEVGSVLSVDQMLARAKAAAGSSSTAGMTKIQKMIAEMEAGVDQDSVNLSPVGKMLKQQAAAAEAKKSSADYTDQDWYVNAKVAQLRGQIQLYSTLPGLDPSGAVMDSLTQEVNDLVSKQQKKIKDTRAEMDAKQAELDKLEAEKKNAPLSADKMLERAKNSALGISNEEPLSDEVKALLDKLKKGVSA